MDSILAINVPTTKTAKGLKHKKNSHIYNLSCGFTLCNAFYVVEQLQWATRLGRR